MYSLLWFVTPLLESGENKQIHLYNKDILQELIEINCFNLHFMTLMKHFLGLHEDSKPSLDLFIRCSVWQRGSSSTSEE